MVPGEEQSGGFTSITSLQARHLKSVVNYVEKPTNSTKTEYLLTPETLSGELIITSLPAYLRIRQLDAPLTLFARSVIDFNRQKMGEIERHLKTLVSTICRYK